jgi:hypothetical protein
VQVSLSWRSSSLSALSSQVAQILKVEVKIRLKKQAFYKMKSLTDFTAQRFFVFFVFDKLLTEKRKNYSKKSK